MNSRDDLRRWLAGRSDQELEQTLTLRPDVLWGAPVRDLDDLADRLVHGISVAAVVGDLPAPALQALEVLSAAGAGASRERVSALLDVAGSGRDGEEAHHEQVGRFLRLLEDGALIWRSSDDRLDPEGLTGATSRLVLNPGVHEVIPYPLGFGRPVEAMLSLVSAADLKRVLKRWGINPLGRKADLVETVRTYFADGARVRRLVGSAPEPVARLLIDHSRESARRAVGLDSPRTRSDDEQQYLDYLHDQAAYVAHQAAVAWARDHGLGFDPYGAFSGRIELPSEAVLALVDPGFRAPFTPVPPAVAIAPVSDSQVRSSAGGAITEFLAAAMATLESMSRTPLAGLKAGGVGARELAKVAKSHGARVEDVRLSLELAAYLGLLHREDDGRLGTGPAFTQWRRSSPAERAADLITIWFGLDYAPTIDRDKEGRSLPALGRLDLSDHARSVRLLACTHLAELDVGVGVAAVDSLAGRLAWRLPILMAGGAAPVLHASWVEGEALGVLALGRLSAVGTALLRSDRVSLVAALQQMLPDVQTKALFGSDLTVIVPGSPAPAVVDLLDAVAVREARGTASTWRVTPQSLREALDAGYAAADLRDRLRLLTDGALPQALDYLIGDVDRRYGHAEVRPAGAVVQSDDDGLLAEIMVHRALRKLGLQQIAPTVLVAAAPAAEVVAALRAAGYLPLELSSSGDRVVQLQSPPHDGPTDAAVEDSPRTPVETRAEIPIQNSIRAAVEGVDEVVREWAAALGMHAPTSSQPDLTEHEADGTSGRSIDRAADLFADLPSDFPQVEASESPGAAAARLAAGLLPAGADRTSVRERQIQLAAPRLSAHEVRQLAHAVEFGEPVKIVYRSSSGGLTVRVVSELSLQPGHLVGWCHLRRDARTFLLSSIHAVTPNPPPPSSSGSA